MFGQLDCTSIISQYMFSNREHICDARSTGFYLGNMVVYLRWQSFSRSSAADYPRDYRLKFRTFGTVASRVASIPNFNQFYQHFLSIATISPVLYVAPFSVVPTHLTVFQILFTQCQQNQSELLQYAISFKCGRIPYKHAQHV